MMPYWAILEMILTYVGAIEGWFSKILKAKNKVVQAEPETRAALGIAAQAPSSASASSSSGPAACAAVSAKPTVAWSRPGLRSTVFDLTCSLCRQ